MMKVKEAIEKRRAYRSLDKAEITDELIKDLSLSASLAPSCFNKQPWRFVFVKSYEQLKKIKGTLSKGNEWAEKASLIIAVFSSKEDDCIIKGKEYYFFDTGMATAFLILRATELDLVAHPIAGFDEDKVKEVLNIPENYRVITLLILGKRSTTISNELSEWQKEAEVKRPERKSLDEFSFIDKFK